MTNNEPIIKDDSNITEISAFKTEGVSPLAQFRFAQRILLGCAAIFAASGVAASFCQAGIPVFDACKTILPPIATLVIGYYFGEAKNK